MISWATCVSLTGEKQNVYRVLVGKAEVKHLLGRHRLRRECSVWMYFEKNKIRGPNLDWFSIEKFQDARDNGNGPSKSIKC